MTTHYRYRIELASASNARPVRTYTPWRPGQVAAYFTLADAAPGGLVHGGTLDTLALWHDAGQIAVAHLEASASVESGCLTPPVNRDGLPPISILERAR